MNKSQQIKHILMLESPTFRKTFLLEENTYTIGRTSLNSIPISSKTISRTHALLLKVTYPQQPEKDFFWLIDGDFKGNKSTNGLFVNGKRCFYHQLKPGDIIFLGGKEVRAKYEKLSYQAKKTTEDLLILEDEFDAEAKREKSLAEEDLKTTSFSIDDDLDKITEDFFFKLRENPELLPSPIIEINDSGEITYINAAANQKFSDLETLLLDHPLLKGLLTELKNIQGNLLVREVKIGQELFTQYAHYIPENQLIRSYIFDFTQRKEIEEELKETEARYRAIVKQISEGIVLIDPVNKKILDANVAYCNLLGYTLEEIKELTLDKIVAINHEILEQDIERILTEKLDFFRESIHRSKNGSLIDVEETFSTIIYQGKQVLCLTVNDITNRKRSQEILRYQAGYDLLTGLVNRKLFTEQLSATIAYAKRKKKQLAVMFLELDRCENINNVFGYEFGDQLLQIIAKKLKTCLHLGDTPAYWSGNKFTVLLPQISNTETVTNMATKIIETVAEPLELANQLLHLNISIGIAIYPQDGEDGESLIKMADTALFNAKKKGGKSYQFYTPQMTTELEDLLQLENCLYSAFTQKEFYLTYQPQVDVNSGKILSLETLLGWNNLKLGEVSQALFLPLAEEIRVILPMIEWILYQVCNQNKTWQNAGLPSVRVAVKIPGSLLQDENLVSMVKRVLNDSGLAPNFLELVITESTKINKLETFWKSLRELLNLGVQLTLDNFGSGDASLIYLKQFPFHQVKLDGEFVRDIVDDPRSKTIISAAIALGKTLNLKVIAQEVNSQQQMEILKDMQCEQMQGSFFSLPLTTEEVTNLLSEYNGAIN